MHKLSSSSHSPHRPVASLSTSRNGLHLSVAVYKPFSFQIAKSMLQLDQLLPLTTGVQVEYDCMITEPDF